MKITYNIDMLDLMREHEAALETTKARPYAYFDRCRSFEIVSLRMLRALRKAFPRAEIAIGDVSDAVIRDHRNEPGVHADSDELQERATKVVRDAWADLSVENRWLVRMRPGRYRDLLKEG